MSGGKKKYILYVKEHDYLDTALLALRAAKSLEDSEHKDCIYSYDETLIMYAKKNPKGITVKDISNE